MIGLVAATTKIVRIIVYLRHYDIYFVVMLREIVDAQFNTVGRTAEILWVLFQNLVSEIGHDVIIRDR